MNALELAVFCKLEQKCGMADLQKFNSSEYQNIKSCQSDMLVVMQATVACEITTLSYLFLLTKTSE